MAIIPSPQKPAGQSPRNRLKKAADRSRSPMAIIIQDGKQSRGCFNFHPSRFSPEI
jgi:hypothetical protein